METLALINSHQNLETNNPEGSPSISELSQLSSIIRDMLNDNPEGLISPLNERINTATESIDFHETPEIRRGLEGFFKDHYRLAELIVRVLDMDEDPVSLDESGRINSAQYLEEFAQHPFLQEEDWYENFKEYGLIYTDGSVMPPAISNIILPYIARLRIDRLLDPQNDVLKERELELLSIACLSLFNEPSIGITALDSQEIDLMQYIFDQTKDRISSSEYFNERGFRIIGDNKPGVMPSLGIDINKLNTPPKRIIDKARERFWQSTIPAGKLLFHNSPKEVTDGVLRTRRMQDLRTGVVDVGTVLHNSNGGLHSPTIHFSESFDRSGYKGDDGISYGVPISEIIRSASYGRDSEFTEAAIKGDRNPAISFTTQHVGSIGGAVQTL
jgi:hypothetical protein